MRPINKWNDLIALIWGAFLCVFFATKTPHLLFLPCAAFLFLQIFQSFDCFHPCIHVCQKCDKESKKRPSFCVCVSKSNHLADLALICRRKNSASCFGFPHKNIFLLWRRFALLRSVCNETKMETKLLLLLRKYITHNKTLRPYMHILLSFAFASAALPKWASEKKLPRAGWGQWPGNELETLIVASKTKRKIWRGNEGEKYFYAYIMRLKKRERNHTSFYESFKSERAHNVITRFISFESPSTARKDHELTQLRIIIFLHVLQLRTKIIIGLWIKHIEPII